MALLKFWVASEVWQDAEGSWGSPLIEDFGIEYGPITQDGTVYINRQYRRDDQLGWLRGDVPFYTRGVVTDGVQQWSDILAVSYPIVPAVAIVECVADSDVLLQIHMGVGSTTGSHYRVLAATLHPDEDPANAPAWLDGVGPDVPFSPTRWTQIRDGMVFLGVPAEQIDQWRSNNPDGTPREFFAVLQSYIQSQQEQLETLKMATSSRREGLLAEVVNPEPADIPPPPMATQIVFVDHIPFWLKVVVGVETTIILAGLAMAVF
jgi:hypothetical protein